MIFQFRPVTVLEEQCQKIEEIDQKLFKLENALHSRSLTTETSKAEIEKEIVELSEQKKSIRRYAEVSSELRLNYRVIDLRVSFGIFILTL
jgi:hypothetical protein